MAIFVQNVTPDTPNFSGSFSNIKSAALSFLYLYFLVCSKVRFSKSGEYNFKLGPKLRLKWLNFKNLKKCNMGLDFNILKAADFEFKVNFFIRSPICQKKAKF